MDNYFEEIFSFLTRYVFMSALYVSVFTYFIVGTMEALINICELYDKI